MGLPKYIKDKLSEKYFHPAIRWCINHVFNEYYSKPDTLLFNNNIVDVKSIINAKSKSRGKKQIDYYKYIYKLSYFSRLKDNKQHDKISDISLIEQKKYIGINNDGFAEYTTVNIRLIYIEKYKKMQEKKLIKDIEDINRKIFIQKMKDKVYKSRSFPPSLSVFILERDNYTCQICLKSREELKEIGLSLEIDHIKEWEDGGETTINNGQAICSACNKGKHYAKKIYRKMFA